MRVLGKVWTIVWKIVAFVVLWGVLYSPVILIVEFAGPGSEGLDPETRVYVEALGAITMIVAAWVMARRADRRSLRSLGFAPKRLVRDVLVGFLVGIGMLALALLPLWAAGWAEPVPAPDFSGSVLALLGGAMLFNAVSQEVMVRGWVLQTIETEFGVSTALLVSTLVFTALHAGAIVEGGVLPGVNLFGAGLLLGFAYTTTRNLWLPIALHFAWNFVEGPVLGIAVSGQPLDGGWDFVTLSGPTLATGGAFGLEGGLAATLATAAGIGVLVLLGRNPHATVRGGRGRERGRRG